MKLKAITCIILTSGMIACGQADTANQHLGSMDESAQKLLEEIRKSQVTLDKATTELSRMADTLTAFQQMGLDLFKIFGNANASKTPAKTDDIDDVLGEKQ